MKLKELKEKRADIVRSLNALCDGVSKDNRNFTEEEKTQYEKLDSEQRTLAEEIDTTERIERSKHLVTPEYKEAVNYRPAQVAPEEKDLAFRAWALASAGCNHLITDKMTRAVERTGLSLQSNSLIFRGQTVGTANQGGNLVDGSIFQGIDNALKAYGGIRSVAKVVRTENGNPIHWATSDDTGSVGAIVGENTTVANTSMTFGKKTLNAYKYASGVYPVSIELIQDAGVDIASVVGDALGTRLARIHNTHFTSGDGSSKPTGVLTDSTAGVTAAGAAAITVSELIDLYHAVDSSYRNDAVWMMSDATFAYLKKLKDSNNRPLFLYDYVNGSPSSLLGKNVVINNDMPAIGASAKPIMFGSFTRFIVRDVSDITIKVLNELYALDGSVAFVAFSRNDCKLLNTAAVKHLVMAAS